LNVRNWLITNRRTRRILVVIARYVLKDRICDLLYPDDLVITFGDVDPTLDDVVTTNPNLFLTEKERRASK